MSAKKEICVICAWRVTCQKKFTVSGRDIRCPDFVKDLSLKDNKEEDKNAGKEI